MRSRTVRALVVAMGAVFGVLFVAPVAFAHPLGNFTVNRFSRIVLLPGHVRVDYVIDMAEIPTFQTMPAIEPRRARSTGSHAPKLPCSARTA